MQKLGKGMHKSTLYCDVIENGRTPLGHFFPRAALGEHFSHVLIYYWSELIIWDFLTDAVR